MKIEGNKTRDARTIAELQAAGWRVLVVWECALRGKRRLPFSDLVNITQAFIESGHELFFEVSS